MDDTHSAGYEAALIDVMDALQVECHRIARQCDPEEPTARAEARMLMRVADLLLGYCPQAR